MHVLSNTSKNVKHDSEKVPDGIHIRKKYLKSNTIKELQISTLYN